MEELTALARIKADAETGQRCITCGREGPGMYCPRCGEKQRHDEDFSLRHLLSEAAETFFHVDSKVFCTLKILVSKPGKLTQEFFLGRRKPYMSPLQTFFVCNLLFFVLQPLTRLEILAPPLRAFESSTLLKPVATRLVDQRLARKHFSRSVAQQFTEFSDRFDRISHLQAKSLILILAPMLAIVIAGLNFRSRHYFSEHVIFSLHAYAWWLLWLLVVLLLMALLIVLASAAGSPMDAEFIDICATALEFGGLGLYLFLASRRFYQDRLLPGVIKGAVLTVCGYGLFQLYRMLLLFTVLYST